MTPLVTRAEYDALPPRAQGYVRYMQAALPGSEIPDVNPYTPGTPEYGEFGNGEFAAILQVQDMDS